MVWLSRSPFMRRIGEAMIPGVASALMVVFLLLVGFGSGVASASDPCQAAPGSPYDVAKYNYDPGSDTALSRSPVCSGSLAPVVSLEDGVYPAARVLGHIFDSGVSRVAPRTLDLPTSQTRGRLDTLDDHFARHGADFGATSADDYARQASEFLQQPGTLTKIDPKTGVIRVYDPATNTFGAYNPTGTTRTFYMPDPAKHGYPTNLDSWKVQPG